MGLVDSQTVKMANTENQTTTNDQNHQDVEDIDESEFKDFEPEVIASEVHKVQESIFISDIALSKIANQSEVVVSKAAAETVQ